MVAEMSVANAAQELGLQCVQQSENGATNGSEVGGGSPKSSTIQTSSSPLSPSKAGIELIFGPNGEVLTQPSSPPHNYRHSRAYRHFKNPPQPHMCIRVSTAAGEEVFINVLSWTRIVVPQEPTDPIPLYGGMKVPPGSPRCPPLVYAVMANPEVLKDSGRHSKDPEERRAMIELMCDFVEAMNPDLKLNRNAVILKDRDISGELKDVWNAVQAQRDREREEQMLQQQSHAPPPQQMYLPHKQDASQGNLQNSSDSVNVSDNKVVYGEFGPETAFIQNDASKSLNHSTQHNSNDDTTPPTTAVTQSAISNNANPMKNSSVNDVQEKTDAVDDLSVGHDQTDSINNSLQNGAKNQQLDNNSTNNTGPSGKQKKNASPTNGTHPATAIQSSVTANTVTGKSTQEGTSPVTSPVSPTTASPSTPPSTILTSSSSNISTTTTTTTSTKKEKLGGFLPNSCIFPRFKNKNKDKNKEKDKDKEKDKSSNHSKERTLLNSLKKTTTAATNAFTSKSQQSHNDDSTSNSVKNCLNLEAEVEKLDLNKMDAPHANDVLIKVATPAAK